MNVYKEYDQRVENNVVLDELKLCQKNCHKWGRANKIEFEQSKESFSVLHRKDPYGKNFKLLGARYDTNMNMQATINELKKQVDWRVRSLYRLRKFFTLSQMIKLY